jgi:hypothetical protein
MDSACARPRCHDGHLEPAICLDAVRQAVPGRNGRGAADRADHVLAADRAADIVLPGAGVARRPVRAEDAGRRRRGADRARVGPLGARRQRLDAVPDLRALLRRRHRHRLCRRRRPDGEMVSGPAWVRHRDRRGRLWNGRHADDISHLLDADNLWRADDARRVRRHSAASAFSPRSDCASRGWAKPRPPRRRARMGET